MLPKSEREKQNELFLNQFESQNEFELKQKEKIDKFYSDYKDELEDYEYISDLNKYNKLKKGGYIRYFNLNNELRWGGILIKKVKNKHLDLMVLCNSTSNRFIVSFQKNYIFYKNHQTASDKTRKLFLSALDKYTDYND